LGESIEECKWLESKNVDSMLGYMVWCCRRHCCLRHTQMMVRIAFYNGYNMGENGQKIGSLQIVDSKGHKRNLQLEYCSAKFEVVGCDYLGCYDDAQPLSNPLKNSCQ
jgi:hypothetical protein